MRLYSRPMTPAQAAPGKDAAASSGKSSPKTAEKPVEPEPATPARSAADAPVFNLAKLSIEQLNTLIEQARVELSDRQQKATADLVAEFRARAEKLGLDPVTVAAMLSPRAKGRRGSGDKRGSVAPKYRNPADPSQTWAGRGKVPGWIELAPAAPGEKRGKPLPKFLIPHAQ